MKPICLIIVLLGLMTGVLAPASHCTGQRLPNDVAFRKAMGKAVRAAAEHALDSVVTIEVIGAIGRGGGDVAADAPTSGVIVSSDGLILASSIVVRRPSATILVALPDGSRHAATVVSRDYHRDLVLLKINPPTTLRPISMLDRFELPIGSTTIAVGRYGSEQSPMISTGVLSAIDRLEGIAIQTDARVPPAMYGGPLIDLRGNVLGILIPAIAQGGAEDVTSWYDSGIAFAIPTDVIADKLQRMRDGKDIKKGLIGMVAASRDMTDANTKVAAVRPRSPAEVAGMKAGDRITSVDGQPVMRFQQIRQILGRFDAGEKIGIELERNDQPVSLEVTLADEIPPLKPQRLGVVVSEQSTEDQVVLRVDAVVPGTPAAGQLRAGDTLSRLNGNTLDSAIALHRQLVVAEPERAMTISYERDSQAGEVKLTPASIAGKPLGQLPPPWVERAKQAPEWKVAKIQLPESANPAAYVGPPESDSDSSGDRLGLLVLVLEPGQRQPADVVESWRVAGQKSGVIVCAVASEKPNRWHPKEIEVIASLAKAMVKKAPIDPSSVAVGTVGGYSASSKSSADTMALVAAVSQPEVFGGVAISPQAKAPAIRLRPNDPSTSLELLLPLSPTDELPAWGPTFENAGYPIIRSGTSEKSGVLVWVRLLQSI